MGCLVMATAGGMLIGFLPARLLAVYSRFLLEPWIVSIIVQGISGIIAGAVTGLALVWIVWKPEMATISSVDELQGTKGSYRAPDRRQ